MLARVLAGQQSRTAEYVALFRALETNRPRGKRLFADPLATAFLSPPLRFAAAAAGVPVVGGLVPWLIDRRVPGPRASAAIRTRVIDDALDSAINRDSDPVEQVVILGAGYDSRAYRVAGIDRLAVFEVDHPDTQTIKRQVVDGVLGRLPEHVRLVPIDFDRQTLDGVLEAAGLVPGRPTFIIWEGVASYLTPDAVDATVRWARAIAGPGSEFDLTYVHRGILDGTTSFPHAQPWVDSVKNAGEPFVFGFDPSELGDYLAARGWELIEDLSTTEALAQHGSDASNVPSFYRIARARL
jgi:methyltransferase (TIGR00027 family)